MKTLSRVIFLVFFWFSLSIAADDIHDAQWKALQKKADKLYGGYDVTIGVVLGYQSTIDDDTKDTSVESGPYGRVEMQVPIYSKADIAKRRQEKINFLAKGAELIRQIQQYKSEVEIMKEQSNLLRVLIPDEGIKGVEAYYNNLRKIAELENKIIAAQRELDAMLE